MPLGVWATRGFDADRIRDGSAEAKQKAAPGTLQHVPCEAFQHGRAREANNSDSQRLIGQGEARSANAKALTAVIPLRWMTPVGSSTSTCSLLTMYWLARIRWG